MLNGQLQLTDIALARPCRACAVRFISWAPSAWPSWPVALPRASAPRGRHGRRAANHRDGPAWRQLRRQAGRHALQDRAFEQRRRRERQALEQPQRSQPDFRGPGAQAVRRRRAAGGATQVTPVASPVVLDAAAPLDQPSDSGAATSTPSTATPPGAHAGRKPARAADAGVINWGWPATGQITQGFNNNTKGIDIAGNLGDPVIAAADGKVMYSGNACAAWAT